jgi:ATP-dependent RNA helicase RhlE
VNDSTFAALGLTQRLLRALEDAQYPSPTSIQQRAIPPLLDGADLLGIAQTGTGKTAAFTLPLLQMLREDSEDGITVSPRSARALILAPTRELALQIAESVKTYGRYSPMRVAVVMGGVNARAQIDALRRGVDILIATPGRLLDLANQRCVDLSDCDYLVIDEADRMLDMGFIRDVRKIVAMLPEDRQTLLFSATMPDEITRLAGSILYEPERVEVRARTVAVEKIEQYVRHLPREAKRDRLAELLASPDLTKVIVFTRTKRGANQVVKRLGTDGIAAQALHGNKSQSARQRTLAGFRDGRFRVLVATDIASRGLDVDDISHVINYELPHEPEAYVHRIGRTARAGASGIAISFCDPSELAQLRAIERLTKTSLDVIGAEPSVREGHPGAKAKGGPARRGRSRRRPRRPATLDRHAA